MKTLLLWDDNLEKRILSEALKVMGLSVHQETDLALSLDQWGSDPADIIVIAQRLSNPLDTVHCIRHHSVAPLLLILNPVGEDIHMALLKAGADMVFERPFSMRLFLGYMMVFMRRSGTVLSDSLPAVQEQAIFLDPSRHIVQVGEGKTQKLSQLEFRLLHTLMVHRNHVLSTDTLVEHVWGYTGDGHRDLVRGLVNRLRAKIEINRRSPRYIHTVPGVGYTFRADRD